MEHKIEDSMQALRGQEPLGEALGVNTSEFKMCLEVSLFGEVLWFELGLSLLGRCSVP
jgi:hypothetical protein